MTSNIGAKALTKEAAKIGFGLSTDKLKQAENDFNEKKEQVLKEMKDFFRPEFLNRIDKSIVFRPLTTENIKEIVRINLGELNDRLKEKAIQIDVAPKAIELLAKLSYAPEYGARSVRRKIQDLTADQMPERILSV